MVSLECIPWQRAARITFLIRYSVSCTRVHFSLYFDEYRASVYKFEEVNSHQNLVASSNLRRQHFKHRSSSNPSFRNIFNVFNSTIGTIYYEFTKKSLVYKFFTQKWTVRSS